MISLIITFIVALLINIAVFLAGVIYYAIKTRGKRSQQPDTTEDKPNVLLLVLGDIGRSPRMQYHALSLAENNYHVDFVGYKGKLLFFFFFFFFFFIYLFFQEKNITLFPLIYII